jgi:hypothetical protein
MKVDFWLSNPLILLDKEYINEIFPDKSYSLERKMNALTRIILLLGILGYLITKSTKIAVSSIVTLIIIIVMYKGEKSKSNKLTKDKINELKQTQEGFTNPEIYKLTKSEFTNPTKENPMMNVSLNEYVDNPTRKQAAPSYNVAVENEINENVKKNLDPRLFKDLGDDLYFEQSMRQFYTNPNTNIPNAQKEFAEFCYGGMLSGKEGDIY